MLQIFINIILTIDVIVCILLIFLTLMQRPKQEGLGAAFGGGMTENLFGAQTTNVLAKATRVLGATFFILTLGLSALYSHKATAPSSVESKLPKTAPAPAATATPAASVSPEAPAVTPADSATATPTAPSASPAASAAPAASATITTPAPSPEAAPSATPAATPEDK